MRHDTDPTPPEGIPRPAAADLAAAWLNDAGAILRGDDDRAVLDTLGLALDTLGLAVRLWHSGDGDTLATMLTASARDLFGWRDCPHCQEITHPDEWDARGYCSACFADGAVECDACHEPGRVLDSEKICRDCAEDDQDRDAYGAPYGGRDDLDAPALRDALVRWHDDDEPMRVRFGIIPDGYDGDTGDLRGDLSVFYWLTRTEAAILLPGSDEWHDEWQVVDCETPEPCRHGHFECAVIAGGLCWQGARDDRDDLGNPFGGALDR